MRYRDLISRSFAFAATALAFVGGSARGQDIVGMNQDFDRQFNQTLSALQRQNAAAQEQLWQEHLRVNGPRLRAQYRQYQAAGNGGISFEQFAYWDLMTAAGTNIAGAQEAQRRQFEGDQAAHRTVQEGYRSYNDGWAQNTRRTSETATRYAEGAIRGNAPFVDPRTGATEMLPYSLPAGRVINVSGVPHVRDETGAYFRWTGSNWDRMQAGR